MIVESMGSLGALFYIGIGCVSSTLRRPTKQSTGEPTDGGQPECTHYGAPYSYCREDNGLGSCPDHTLEIFFWPICCMIYSVESYKGAHPAADESEKKPLTQPVEKDPTPTLN